MHTQYFESTYGGKTRGNYFTSTWLGQRQDCNCCRDSILPHDLRSSPPHSPVGPAAGMGLSIVNKIGAINCAKLL